MARTQLGRPAGASGEQTRQRVILATMKCVAEVGYSRATIRQIAQLAHVTSASLYNYFPNKSDLIRATIATRSETAMPRLRRAAAAAGTVVDRITAVLEECGELLRDYPDLAAFEWAIRAENIGSDGASGDTRPGFESVREILADIVGDAHQNGELGPDPDPQAVLEAVYALIYGLTELAATLAPADFHDALGASKVLVAGALFGSSSSDAIN